MNARTLARRLPGVVDHAPLERIAWRVALAAAGRIRVGCLSVVLPDGSRRVFGDVESELRGEIRLHEPEARRAGAHRWRDGRRRGVHGRALVELSLAGLLRLAALNRESLALSGMVPHPRQLGRTLAHRTRRNTGSGSRRNVAAHYDLGNDFYRLFLDETLTYSSAVFDTPDQPLAAAQRGKYRRVADGAGLRRGQHVLEIGTGWGGLPCTAGELGCRVTSITISRAQYDLACERVRAAGLEDLIEISCAITARSAGRTT